MPYIHPDLRIGPIAPRTAGELDYQLTLCILLYLNKLGMSFNTLSVIVGVLDHVKHEFERRVIDPYEDTKKELNGDVYPELPES